MNAWRGPARAALQPVGDGCYSSGASPACYTPEVSRVPPPWVASSFDASAMEAVKKDLMDMLVRELKEELEARGEPKTGNKAWLRRRLHGAIVRARLKSGEDDSF